jgi:hypothetical protein
MPIDFGALESGFAHLELAVVPGVVEPARAGNPTVQRVFEPAEPVDPELFATLLAGWPESVSEVEQHYCLLA